MRFPEWLLHAINRHLSKSTRLRYLPANARDRRNRQSVIEALHTVVTSTVFTRECSIHLTDDDFRPFVNKELFFRTLGALLCAPDMLHSWKISLTCRGYHFRCGNSSFGFVGVPLVPVRFLAQPACLEWHFSRTLSRSFAPYKRHDGSPLSISHVSHAGRGCDGLRGPDPLYGHP